MTHDVFEWKFCNERIYWVDGAHWLPAHFQLWGIEGFCHRCKAQLHNDEQCYLYNIPILDKLKKTAKNIYHIRTKHLTLKGIQICCTICFWEMSSPGAQFHKVVFKSSV